jgi:ferritin-like metal-binding protein YciE
VPALTARQLNGRLPQTNQLRALLERRRADLQDQVTRLTNVIERNTQILADMLWNDTDDESMSDRLGAVITNAQRMIARFTAQIADLGASLLRVRRLQGPL